MSRYFFLGFTLLVKSSATEYVWSSINDLERLLLTGEFDLCMAHSAKKIKEETCKNY